MFDFIDVTDFVERFNIFLIKEISGKIKDQESEVVQAIEYCFSLCEMFFIIL